MKRCCGMFLVSLTVTLLGFLTLAFADAREDWRGLYRQWETHFDAGRYREAEPFARQMVELSERSLTNVPTLIANSYNNLGLTYRGLGRYADAEKAQLKTLQLREQLLGPKHLDVARTLSNLGYVYHNQGRYELAEKTYLRALEIKRAQLTANDLDLTNTYHNLAGLYADMERYADAEKLHQQALAIEEARLGANHPDVADSLSGLSTIRTNTGRYAEAEQLAKRALQIYQTAYGPNHLRVSNVLANLSSLARRQGRYPDAEEQQRQVLAIREKLLGKDHPYVADTLASLAAILFERGQYAAAEELHQRAIKLLEEKLGPDHANLAGPLSNYSLLLRDRHRFEEAEALLRRSLTIQEKAFGAGHPSTFQQWNALGILFREQGKYDEAENCHTTALEVLKKVTAVPQSVIADTEHNLASVYHAAGQTLEAQRLEQEVLKTRERILGPVHPDVAQSLHNLAEMQMSQQHFREAESLQQKELLVLERSVGNKNAQLVPALYGLATSLFRQGRYSDAELALTRATSILEAARGPEHLDVGIALNLQALMLESQQRDQESERLHLRVLNLRRKVLGNDHPDVAMSLNNLAIVSRKLGRLKEAEDYLLKAKTIYEATPEKQTGGASCLNNLGLVYLDQGRPADAEQAHREALVMEERTSGAESRGAALNLNNLSNVFHSQGRLAEADEFVTRAITIADKIGLSPGERFTSYDLRAQVRWKLGRHEDAFADLEQALKLADQQRAQGSGGDQERATQFVQFAKGFDRMLEWAVEKDDIRKAFEIAERSRSRAFLDQVELRSTDLLAGIPESEAQEFRSRQAKGRERLAALERRLTASASSSVDESQRQELLTNLRQAQQEVADAYRQIRTASPAYRLAIGRDFQPLTLSKVQDWAAQQDALLLEYHFTETSGFLFVVPPSGDAQVVRLAITDEQAARLQISAGPLNSAKLNALLMVGDRSLFQHLSAPESAASSNVTSRLASLWEVLIPDAVRAELLGGKFKRLFVIPHGPLALIPFEVLVVQTGDSPEYLLDAGPPIAYGPSAMAMLSLAALPSRSPPKDLKPVLTISDPLYPSDKPNDSSSMTTSTSADSLATGSRYSNLGGRLSKLPYSGVESRWLTDVFGKSGVLVGQLTGKAATEAAVRYNVPGRYIIHFACHGLTDATFGNLFGSLALSPGSGEPLDDGYLTLAEIYELNMLGCELAILSACHTNYGPQQRAEGTWTLSRGFLVAGTRRVIASNWLVDDEAAAGQVSYLCGGIAKSLEGKESISYAKNLNAAKRWVRQQDKWKSPYYWGSLVLIGPDS